MYKSLNHLMYESNSMTVYASIYVSFCLYIDVSVSWLSHPYTHTSTHAYMHTVHAYTHANKFVVQSVCPYKQTYMDADYGAHTMFLSRLTHSCGCGMRVRKLVMTIVETIKHNES
jgi:hypothetical protein